MKAQPPFPQPRSPEQAFRNYEFHLAEAKKWRRRRDWLLVLLGAELAWVVWRFVL